MPTYTAPGVYVEEVPSSQKVLSAAPTAVAPRLVTSWSQFEGLYGGFSPGCVLPLSVYGYFANGGSIAYICRIANTAPAGQPSRLTLPAADRALGEPLVVESLEPDAPISIEIASIDPGENAPEGPSPFTLTVQLDVLKPGRYELQKATPVPVPVSSRKFAGSESARNGINGLAVADEVTMVVVPDLITAATKDDGTVDLNLWKAVQTALISHCEQNGNRMAILDAPPGMTPQQIKEWRSDVAMYDSAYAALYYPWIKVDNPIGVNGNSEMLIPPSGHIAGVWARTD